MFIKLIRKKLDFTTKEIGELSLIAAVLAFCFSFRDWGIQQFSWSIGVNNYIITLIVVAVSLLVHELGHKTVGVLHGAKIGFTFWPVGLALAIIISFLTNGWFIFASVWIVKITADELARSKLKKPNIGPYEAGKIALSGAMISIFLAIFARIFSDGSYFFSKMVYVNVWIAVMNLIPFFSILFASYRLRGHAAIKSELMPRIEGEYVFFGSRPLWFFSFAFVLLCGISLFIFSSAISLIIGLFCGTALYLIYHYFCVFKWA